MSTILHRRTIANTGDITVPSSASIDLPGFNLPPITYDGNDIRIALVLPRVRSSGSSSFSLALVVEGQSTPIGSFSDTLSTANRLIRVEGWIPMAGLYMPAVGDVLKIKATAAGQDTFTVTIDPSYTIFGAFTPSLVAEQYD